MSQELQIPVVDLQDLSSPRQDAQDRAAQALMEAFGHYGLVYIRNHGIDAEELEAFYDSFIEVTDRDQSEKETWSMPEIWFQRGWTPPNTEKAVVAGGQPDFKECFFIAPEPIDPIGALVYPQVYSENVWPNDADDFRETYMSIGHQLHEVGLSLLRGCARALDLKPFTFEERVYHGPHVTRALRYLPLTPEQVEKVSGGRAELRLHLGAPGRSRPRPRRVRVPDLRQRRRDLPHRRRPRPARCIAAE